MKLTKVHVKEFQSIIDSNEFEVNDITCLVGKNEAGKTALLKALYRLNPIIEADGSFDVTDDYPRASVEEYQQDVELNKREPAIVIKATFELSNDEIDKIELAFCENLFKSKCFTYSKNYEGKTFFSLEINESNFVKQLILDAKLSQEFQNELNNLKSIEELKKNIELETDGERQEHLNRVLNHEIFKQNINLSKYIFCNYIKPIIPKFLYFDEYFMMRGHENIQAFKNRFDTNKLLDSDRPLLGLIELARLNLEQLLNNSRTEQLINKLEGASNYLSKKILKYWSQNRNIEMKFDVREAKSNDPEGMRQGTNIWARIYDKKRMCTTPLGSRSRGFVWFFSFLAWFDQQQRKFDSFILLLDEPGLYLHGRAQIDLLRFIEEELKTDHQVLYTTHSPFMVDTENFNRVRIVQDVSADSLDLLPEEEDGTKVINEIFQATDDSLFPLQGALGYDISQSLFIGPYSLIVEGVSDLFFIKAISNHLNKLHRISLDERWVITPVGGSSKVPTFVSLLGSQKGLKIATLIDIQKKDIQMIENLYKKKLLKKSNVLTFSDFTNINESDIEDMFENDFYLGLVNLEYQKEFETKLELNMVGDQGRIVKRIEDYFNQTFHDNGFQFSHYRPARYFSENFNTLIPKLSENTFKKFEAAFNKLNKLL